MNYEFYSKVLAHIEKRPEEWDQTNPDEEDAACCFLAHARRIAEIPRPETTLDAGAEALDLNPYGDMALWLFDSERTLNDFRTVGRAAWASR